MNPEPENEVVPPAAGSEPAPEPPIGSAPPRAGVADAVADFIQMFVDYVRQETGDVVHDKLVVPTQVAGQVVAFAIAAAQVLFLGIAFIAVALLLLLAEAVGWPAALLIVGGVLILGAVGLTYMKTRRLQ